MAYWVNDKTFLPNTHLSVITLDPCSAAGQQGTPGQGPRGDKMREITLGQGAKISSVL